MAFNWAGAASGAEDALEQALKMQIERETLADRRAQIADSAEWRKTQAEISRQNADTLAASRKAAADEKTAKTAAAAQRRKWAEETVAAGRPMPVEGEDEKAHAIRTLRYFQAQHFLDTGEDLPPAVVTNLLTPRPVREDPNLLSPAALQQKKDLVKYEAGIKPRSGGSTSDTATRMREKQEAEIATQNYLAYIRTQKPNLQDALTYFDSGPGKQDIIRKSRGLVDLAKLRTMLVNMYRPGMTLKQRMEADMMNATPGGQPYGVPQEPE